MKQVAQKLPNAFGLYDVHGNVWEFCQDRYGEYSKGATTDPRGTANTPEEYYVKRGGIWYGRGGSAARSALRGEAEGPDDRGDQIGFRPSRTVSLE